MTPQNSLGMGGNAGNSPSPSSMYNSISSQGMPTDESTQQSAPPQELSPSDKFIQRVGSAFDPFSSLMKDYPQATQEAEELKKALSNWISSVNGQLSQGAENQSPL